MQKKSSYDLMLILLACCPLLLAQTGDTYPLDTCLVSGEKLGSMGEPIVYLHLGREIRFCCKSCIPKFKKSPAQYLAKLDALIIKDQTGHYPATTCLVSGEKLGGMGEPFAYVHNNRLVKFCCDGCLPKFLKEPQKYLAELDKAVIREQKPNYPLDRCLVGGGKLGDMGEPIDFVYGNRLIRFCCQDCIPKFLKQPALYLGFLQKAYSKTVKKIEHTDHKGHKH